MDKSLEPVAAEIQRQKKLAKRRDHYDRNAEYLRMKAREYYYARKEKNGIENKKRGRKPMSRDGKVNLTVSADGSVKFT